MNLFRKYIFEKSYQLLPENIDSCAEDILRGLQGLVDADTVVKARLVIETKLLMYLEWMSVDTVFQVRLYKYFGRYFVRLELRGDRHDCSIEQKDEYFIRLAKSLNGGNLAELYVYREDTNIFELKLPQKPVNPVVFILLAIVLAGLTSGFFAFFSPEVGQTVSKRLFAPLFKTIMGLLSLTSSFMVFFSVLAGVCSVGDIDKFSKQGKLVISRFIGNTVVCSFLGTVACVALLPIVDDVGESGFQIFYDVVDILLSMLPANAVTPFIDGNAMQILFLALGLGVVILINGDKTKGLVGSIESLNLVIMSCVKYICKLMPLIVYLSIVRLVLGGELEKAVAGWRIIAVVAGVLLFQVIAYTIYHAVRLQKPLLAIVKANLPIGIIGASTASSAACFTKVVDVCRDFYGVAAERSSFCYSLFQMFNKFEGSNLMVFLYFICAAEGVKIPLTTIGVYVLLFSLLAVAIAPVPSGDIPVMLVIIEASGLPLETLALYATFSFILDSISTGARTFTAASEIAVIDKKLREG